MIDYELKTQSVEEVDSSEQVHLVGCSYHINLSTLLVFL